MATLYIVGIGLAPGQVTQEALDALRSVDVVFIEEYTSQFPVGLKNYISKLINREPVALARVDLEERGGLPIVNELKNGRSVALVVIGDALLATTHSTIAVSAASLGFRVRVINGISIVCSALSQAGLSPYKLGPVATVTYERLGVLSTRAYEVLRDNLARGLHTLLLLDIKDGGGFMSVKEAASLLAKMEGMVGGGVVTDDLAAIYESRVGWSDQRIVVSSIVNPPDLEPPSIIIVPGLLNPVEEEFLAKIHGADLALLRRHVGHVKGIMATSRRP